MRHLLFIVFIAAPTVVLAQSLSLNLPSAPDTNGRDSIRGPDIDCSASIDSATKFELGVIFSNSDYDKADDFDRFIDETNDSAGLYARIVMPLGGKPKSRLDCNRLYELELERRQLEIRSLKMQVRQLENLDFAE